MTIWTAIGLPAIVVAAILGGVAIVLGVMEILGSGEEGEDGETL